MFEHHESAVDPEVAETHHDHVVHEDQPAVLAPSAFAWGVSAPAAKHESRDDSEDDPEVAARNAALAAMNAASAAAERRR